MSDHSIHGTTTERAEDWRDSAACVGLDPEAWFARDPIDTAGAVHVCRGCPVRLQCLQFAMEDRADYGVYGGLTGTQRTALRRRTRRANARQSPSWARREKAS